MSIDALSVLLNISVILSILFFPYGLNFYYLLNRAKEYEEAPPERGAKHKVTIQLPIYNERYVIDRLVEACLGIADHYGKNDVQILLLDDSTDETTEIARGIVDKYKSLNYDIDLVHRDSREGFKAGALQNALKFTKHQFIAIFDSDFRPTPDFLDRVIHYFNNQKIGMIQSRWNHLNRNYNFITNAIAIGYDGHHWIEQAGRCIGGFLINFNGAAGVIRRKALEEAGGWQADTLAEDLDASYRMQLKGWKALYIRSVDCSAEIPPTVPAVKRQQARWAHGSMRTFRKLYLGILRHKNLSLGQKAEAFVHLSYYSVHPLMFSSFIVALVAAFLNIRLVNLAPLVNAWAFPMAEISDVPEFLSGFPFGALIWAIGQGAWSAFISIPHWIVLNATIFFCAIAMWVFYAYALQLQGMTFRSHIKPLVALALIGFGISISNTIAVLRGLFGLSPGVFFRTPKYKIENRSDTWRDKKYQIKVSKIVLLEILFGLLGILAIVKTWLEFNIGIIPILLLYSAAYLNIAFLTIKQGSHG